MQDLAVEGSRGGLVGWAAPIYKQTLDDYRALDNVLAPIVTPRSSTEMRLE